MLYRTWLLQVFTIAQFSCPATYASSTIPPQRHTFGAAGDAKISTPNSPPDPDPPGLPITTKLKLRSITTKLRSQKEYLSSAIQRQRQQPRRTKFPNIAAYWHDFNSTTLTTSTPIRLFSNTREIAKTSSSIVTTAVRDYLDHRAATNKSTNINNNNNNIQLQSFSARYYRVGGGCIGLLLSLLLTGPLPPGLKWWTDTCLKENKASCGSVLAASVSIGYGLGQELALVFYFFILIRRRRSATELVTKEMNE